jgi:hypothetical protein
VANWFGRGKPEHPLADSAKVRELLAKLPANDGAQALGEIATWLELMNRADDLELEHRYRNLDLLDGASRDHEHALLREYLDTPRQKKSHEERLWSSAYGLWRELGTGYQQCLRQCEKGAAGASKSSLPIYVGRASRALRQQLRWALLRYESAETGVWADLARLYQLAETAGFVDEAIAVYPGSSGSGTVKQEFLKALMLAASATESLQPTGQDIAARIVAHCCKSFVIAKEPREGCTHWFDLASPKSPVRLVQDPPAGATVRFFGAGPALRELEQIRAHIAYTRSLPDGLDLNGTQHDDELLLGLLKHLEQDWAGKSQARRFERRKVATRVTVVPGLTDIIEAMEFAVNDSLDFTHQAAAESWIAEDMSEGGYGAVIPSVSGDWVEVGSLVGVEGESFRVWRVGLIRRVTRNEQHQQRVGVQLLTQSATLVKLRWKEAASPGKVAVAVPRPAVLISSTLQARKEVDVVVKKGLLDHQENIEMLVADATHVLKAKDTIERGPGYEIIRFEVVRK